MLASFRAAHSSRKRVTLRIMLIAMPWTDHRLPQASIAALSAYLKEREPTWNVSGEYAYLDVAAEDPELYRHIAVDHGSGDRLYATLLYPEMAPTLLQHWRTAVPDSSIWILRRDRERMGQTLETLFENLRQRLTRHIDEMLSRYDFGGAVVGLTTSFGQLFGNLLLARRIKERWPDATIVLGGSTVSPATIADSMLEHYPWIDFIVRGEGELPFHALLKQLEAGGKAPWPKGVVARDQPAATGEIWQVEDLDGLPTPDYDQFFFHPLIQQLEATMAIEGSRGCWWDRTQKNVKSTCHFCNLNVQWAGYRQKSAQRIGAEMRQLAQRYHRTRFTFLDNIVRVKGYDELMEELEGLELDPWIFYEARANLRPHDIVRFYDNGLRGVQFGIEALSTSLLNRVNKGTSVIMNLEVMKTCAELQMQPGSAIGNLIVDYPGSTEEEVDETMRVIDDVASMYQPPSVVLFALGIDSVVHRFHKEYGLSNIRNHDTFRFALPPAVYQSLKLYDYSYDFDMETVADWTPVHTRVSRWKNSYKPHPMYYEDTGTHLRIVRERSGKPAEVTILDGLQADLHRFTAMIRTQSEVHEVFAPTGIAADVARVDAALQELVDHKLVYQEKSRFLSIAVAPDPWVGAKRIRRQHREDQARLAAKQPAQQTPLRLPMLATR